VDVKVGSIGSRAVCMAMAVVIMDAFQPAPGNLYGWRPAHRRGGCHR
jgi:hypothetical protein